MVTGAAGFIGSAVCGELLSQGLEVVAVDNLLPDSYSAAEKGDRWRLLAAQPGVTALEMDLRAPLSPRVLDGVDVLINEAGMPGLIKSWTDFDTYFGCNVGVVANLLSAAQTVSLPHFVQISTSSVYGLEAVGDEDQPTRPVSPYGVTKLAAEELVRAYNRTFGTPFTVLRYFSVYGPGQRPDMAYRRIINQVLRDETVTVYGDGMQSRTNTFVADCARLTVSAALSEATGETYNVAGKHEATLLHAISVIEEASGRQARIQFESPRPGDQRRTIGNSDKAVSRFGYESETSLQQGLEEQFRWQEMLNE